MSLLSINSQIVNGEIPSSSGLHRQKSCVPRVDEKDPLTGLSLETLRIVLIEFEKNVRLPARLLRRGLQRLDDQVENIKKKIWEMEKEEEEKEEEKKDNVKWKKYPESYFHNGCIRKLGINGRCDKTIEEAKKFAEEDPKINGFTVNTWGGADKSSGVYSVWFVCEKAENSDKFWDKERAENEEVPRTGMSHHDHYEKYM